MVLKFFIVAVLFGYHIKTCFSSQPTTFAIKLEDLPSFSKALNIEGLYKIQGANLHKNNMITAYFTQVLDTPGKVIKNIDNGVELTQKIHHSPRGGRMENEILEFHEERANLFWLIILQMYLENAHSFVKKDKNKPVFLTIHLHRGKSAIFHMQLLKKIFVQFFKVPSKLIKQTVFQGIPMIKFKMLKKNLHITIQGDQRHTHKVYLPPPSCDIFLAFGFVGALDSQLSSGDIVIPISSFDFDLNTLTINLTKETKGENHLLKTLPLFLDKYQNSHVINFANNVLFSPFKPRKKAAPYKISDIHTLKILSVQNSFFVPSSLRKKCGKNFEKPCITLMK